MGSECCGLLPLKPETGSSQVSFHDGRKKSKSETTKMVATTKAVQCKRCGDGGSGGVARRDKEADGQNREQGQG